MKNHLILIGSILVGTLIVLLFGTAGLYAIFIVAIWVGVILLDGYHSEKGGYL